MPTIQELKDQAAVIIDSAFAAAFAAGVASAQGGSPMFTQQQLDQAVLAATNAQQVIAAENMALLKQAIKANLAGLNTAEAAAEQAAVDQA